MFTQIDLANKKKNKHVSSEQVSHMTELNGIFNFALLTKSISLLYFGQTIFSFLKIWMDINRQVFRMHILK